ncbi:DUF2171 domain-containing protein [Deinococcus radiopugnans]|uniref:DUF2171 domain-containing protein n=1 Tax=Deinococcus radiopugnans ATCC 19172 TaxID=585398 RepID=A0A5C4Y9L6_9DEIO|nr:DUF2171 domain-containing protein [Deinococcus radiopugnans]MBB6016232.1 hypothetical protein [Deinococcus radiopugnans ATCC 19172]TNM72246.1 DUF2171 domain-containing protein [Deinococcus radiopugnans ATCC 19172]
MTQNQNADAGQITERIAKDLKARLDQGGEHMQVKDKDGEHVGTVDHLDGDRIKLTKSDSSDSQHHYVPLSQVESMDNVAVYLNVTREEAMK